MLVLKLWFDVFLLFWEGKYLVGRIMPMAIDSEAYYLNKKNKNIVTKV